MENSSAPAKTTSMRILLADDEPVLAELVSMVLRYSGHKVRMTSDGAAALAAYEQEAFDLIITDLWMPKLNGLDLAKTVKAKNPGQKIVLLTGSVTEGEAKPPEVDFVLGKPVNVDSLTDILSKVVTS